MKTILHIGLPKTGTTVLQNYMASNRVLLLEHGINYPEIPADGGPQSTNGHHYFAHQLAKSDTNIPAFRNFVEGQKKSLDAVLFLSAEPMARHAIHSSPGVYNTWVDKGRYVSRVRAALGTRDVEILVVLRQAHKLAESAYKELIKKTNANLTFKDFINTRFFGYDFPKLLSLWQRHFGQIKVHLYDDDIVDPEGIVGAIIRPLCPNWPKIPVLPFENTGLHPKFIELKRRINSGDFSKPELAKITAALMQLSDDPNSSQIPSLWTEEMLKVFQKRIERDDQAVALDYFSNRPRLFKPVDYGNMNWFSGITAQDFAQLLDGVAEHLPQSLTDRIVRHLAREMQG